MPSSNWSPTPPEFEDGALYWVCSPLYMIRPTPARMGYAYGVLGSEAFFLTGSSHQNYLARAPAENWLWGDRLQVPDAPHPSPPHAGST